MSGTGRPNLSREAKIWGANGDREKNIFPCSADYEHQAGLATIIPGWRISHSITLCWKCWPYIHTWYEIMCVCVYLLNCTRHAPQKEGGLKILCDLPPVWPRLVRPTNLMSRMDGKKTHTHTHNRATRPCHPSHSMPLALILPRGDQWYLLRKPVCMCVCVCVFIKLHITTQSGPVILVILCHSHWSSRGGINDTVCVCVFIKLPITAQSGPVILLILIVIICYSHWSYYPKRVCLCCFSLCAWWSWFYWFWTHAFASFCPLRVAFASFSLCFSPLHHPPSPIPHPPALVLLN